MKVLIAFLLLIIPGTLLAQMDSTAVHEIRQFQQKLNEEFRNPKESPLEPKLVNKFTEHHFFPIDLKFRVRAKLTRTEDAPFFKMKTTTSRLTNQRRFGIAEFSIEGKTFRLPIYQSADLMEKAEYKDYLFLPFTDLTNGKESYAGGRYIDLRIPANDELIIDFNQAYNPFCAYSHRYSCPIVPRDNDLEVEILAGVKHPD